MFRSLTKERVINLTQLKLSARLKANIRYSFCLHAFRNTSCRHRFTLKAGKIKRNLINILKVPELFTIDKQVYDEFEDVKIFDGLRLTTKYMS